MDSLQDFFREHQIGVAVVVTSVVGLFLLKRYVKSRSCKSKVKLTGKTALVTGSNTGIGKETARDFAFRGARVLMACRDVAKAESAADEIRKTTGNNDVIVYKLDLSSLQSVRDCAAEIKKKEKRLDIVLNNAGVMWCPHWKTADGFELQFGTNHLGHFLFTNLLLDLIKQSAPSRIVNVSSMGHTFVSGMDFNNLNAEKSYDPVTAYSQSKLANILFSRELSRRLKGTGVTANSLHPGAIDSDLPRHISSMPFYYSWPLWLFKPLVRFVMMNTKDGAQTNIYVSVSEELENVTGKYFSDCSVASPSSAAEDDEVAVKLWDVSVKMTGLK